MVKLIFVAALAASATSALFTSPSPNTLSPRSFLSKRLPQLRTDKVANVDEEEEKEILGIGFDFPEGWGPSRQPFGPAVQTTAAKQWGTAYVADCIHAQFLLKDVKNARVYAANYLNSTAGINGSGYPKPFPNTQKFNFSSLVPGPFWEYPLINYGAWLGVLDPGPDRIIINRQGYYAGAITSYNAGAQGYTECTEYFVPWS